MRGVSGERPRALTCRSESPADVGGKAGRIWVMERPGGEQDGVAEAATWAWRAGAASPLHGDGSVWKHHWNYSRRPMCTHACAQGHVHTCTTGPRNPGAAQSHLRIDVTPQWGCRHGVHLGRGQVSRSPAALQSHMAEAQSSTRVTHPQP
jgi:hypothetical protein